MDSLVPVFKDFIFGDSESVVADYAEIGIDSLLSNGVLKDIPFVNTVISVCKTGQNIRERNLIKQTVAFVNAFNSGTIDNIRLQKYKAKINTDNKYAEQELERILIQLDRNIDILKSKFMGKIYAAYINEYITWDIFCELTDIMDRLFVSDIDVLKKAYESDGVYDSMELSYRHERLISYGLMVNQARLSGGIIMRDMDESKPTKLIRLTDIGKIFCKYAFEGF